MAAANASLGVRSQGGRGSFGLFSHDVRPSLNCRTHERTFFTSITPSLHVSLNCRWISIGFMPRKWRNRIITRCSSNVNVAISISKTLLQLDIVTSIQRVVQCCHLASPNLKNSHVSSNNFHVSICFHSREKKIGYIRTWTPHVFYGDAVERGPWPRHSIYITHIDASQSIGLLWISDQSFAETSKWQHTTPKKRQTSMSHGGIRA